MEISEQARAAVRGGFDLHVHVAPDIIPRRITDSELAQRFAELGLGGFALKSHYLPTPERAAVVQRTSGVRVIGTLTLNASVGGMNPIITDIAARAGARIVWLPTVDAENEAAHRAAAPADAPVPVWAQLQRELAAQGVRTPAVAVTGTDGELLEEASQVLDAVARHDLALATGHIAAREVDTVVAAAVAKGIRRIIVTHPEFPSQRLPVDQQLRLAEMGAMIERCLAPALIGHVDLEQMLRNTRIVGPERCILSSDLGQLTNPPVEDGLALFADRFLAAGFGEEEIHQMCVQNPRRLVATD